MAARPTVDVDGLRRTPSRVNPIDHQQLDLLCGGGRSPILPPAMSELLLHWINNELQLSVLVTDVESDFSSGYLFGEILHRLNQQHNFTDFMNSAIADAKIINFCLLEPTLRRLNIKFDSKIATAIMNGKQGAAANVLYQIRTSAERVARAPGVSSKSQDRWNIQPLHNIPSRLPKPSYDAAHHYFFEHSVRRQVKSLRELRDERETIESEKLVMTQHREKLARIQQQLEVTKAERLHQAFIHTQYIKTALDETESPAWRLALAKKSEREHRKAAFYHQLVAEKKRREQSSVFTLRQTVKNDLDNFEQSTSSGCDPMAKSRGNKNLNPSQGYGLRSLSMTLENFQSDTSLRDTCEPISVGETAHEQLENSSLIRDQKLRREQRRDQFGRRRKRFLQDAYHSQLHANATRILLDLDSLVHRVTHREGESAQTNTKILVYKNIVVENRFRRDESYTNRCEMDFHEAIERDTGMFELLFAKYNDDWEVQGLQKNRRRTAQLVAHQHENQLIAGLVLYEIISFAMVVAARRENSMHSRDVGSFLQTDEIWDQLRFQFSICGPCVVDTDADQSLVLENQLLQYLNRFCAPSILATDYVGAVTKGSQLSPWVPSNWKFIAAEDIIEDRFVLGETVKYVRWLALGNPPLPQHQTKFDSNDVSQHGSHVEKSRLETTDECRNPSRVDQKAGEVVIEALNHDSQLPTMQSNHKPASCQSSLRILLLGPPFAGKFTQAQLLATKYDLKLLSVERLLQEAMANHTPLGNDAHFLLTQGQEIPPKIYSQLVLDEIGTIEQHRRDRWILYDFPPTQEHAKNLEECLTNYIDPFEVPSPFDHESVLAPGCKKPRLPRSFLYGTSGVDLAIYLECTENSALERCLGALEDCETHEFKYHLLFCQPAIDSIDRHRLRHVNNKSNASELLSLQCSTTEDRSDGAKTWFAKFDTLREIAITEWQEGESVSTTRSFTPEATQRKLVEMIDAVFDRQQSEVEARQREKELTEERAMLIEESRHWHLNKLLRDISKAQEDISKAQLTVQQAEEAKAKKEELAELKNAVETAKKLLENALVEARDWRLDEVLEIRRKNTVYSERLVPSLGCVLASMWNSMETDYTITMKLCFRLHNQQRERVESRVVWLVDTMSRIFQRVDNKQGIMDTLQSHFNDVVDEMRFDEATKCELHARVDVLQDELCLETTTKRRESEDELREVMEDGWLQDACQWSALIYQRALQAECDRFRISVQLLSDALLAASAEPAQLAGVADQLAMNHHLLAEFSLKAFACSPEISEPTSVLPAVASPVAPANTKGTTAKGVTPAVKGKQPLVPTPVSVTTTAVDTPTDPLAPETLLLAYDTVIQRSELLLQLIINAPPKYEEVVAKTLEPGVGQPPHSKTGGKTGSTPAATPSATPVSSTSMLPRQTIDVATSNYVKAVKYEQEMMARRVRYLKDAVQSTGDQMARAFRAVETTLLEWIEQRAVREEAAIASLVCHLRAVIEAETNLPFYINVQPDQVYRFPATQQLLEDTRVTVDSRIRLLPRPCAEAEPKIEEGHAFQLNERQATALRKQLATVCTSAEAEPSSLTTLEVVNVLQMLQNEHHGIPESWQMASEEVLAEVVGSFADENEGIVDTKELIKALRTDESFLKSHLQQL